MTGISRKHLIWQAGLSSAVGLALISALLAMNDAGEIFQALLGAGWGISAVILIRAVQTFLSGLAWRALLAQPAPPGWLMFGVWRWIREAINALLPVAQIGGEVIGARLMALRGVALNAAAAATAVDLTMEMASQVAFTLCGVGLLTIGPYDPAVTRWVGGAAAAALVVVGAFVLAQRGWLFRRLERALLGLAEKSNWAALGEVAGLHHLVVGLYRQPRRLWTGMLFHLASWLVGAVEVLVALRLVGVVVDFPQAVLIESIGQAMRTAGFAIPGSLGVQEGGYILVCGLVGVGPQAAMELSLIKRLREVVFGLPGLLAWQIAEGRQLARRLTRQPETSTEVVP